MNKIFFWRGCYTSFPCTSSAPKPETKSWNFFGTREVRWQASRKKEKTKKKRYKTQSTISKRSDIPNDDVNLVTRQISQAKFFGKWRISSPGVRSDAFKKLLPSTKKSTRTFNKAQKGRCNRRRRQNTKPDDDLLNVLSTILPSSSSWSSSSFFFSNPLARTCGAFKFNTLLLLN